MSIVRNCIRKSVNDGGPAHILTFCHDGIFDYDLCKTPHIFYGAKNSSMVGWNPITKTLPDNFIELPNAFNLQKNDYSFDFVLCNSRDKTYEKANQFSNVLHIPIVMVDHVPFSGRQKCVGNVYTSPVLKVDAMYSELIDYMVEVPEPIEKDIDVLICGQFMKDEYHIVEKIMSDLGNKCVLIGDNPGLSTPVYDEQYIDYFRKTKIYIHLSTYYGISRHLLQAMASNCVVITNKVPATHGILGDNATYITNVENVVTQVKELLDNKNIRLKQSYNLKELVKQKFKPSKFIDKWTKLLYRYKDEVFIK